MAYTRSAPAGLSDTLGTAQARPTRQPRHWQRLSFEESLAGLIFVSPWLFGLVGLTLFPMVFSLVISFYRWDIIGDPLFIGFNNFTRLFDDRLFWISLRQTAIYAGLLVPLMLAFGLFLAVLLNQAIRARDFLRTAFYMPSVIPDVATIMMWIWLLSPQGLINQLLARVGIEGPNWFGSVYWAVPALVITSLWTVGGGMLVYLGGLQGVPTELYEAARIDGANRWQGFWHVTVPMISPIVLYNLVVLVIGSMQAFTGSVIAGGFDERGGGGGPGYATHFLVFYLYRSAFAFLQMGFASALAWVVFVLILVLTLVVLRWSSVWVYYEGLRGRR